MVERFKKDYDDEKDLIVSITKSMGVEKVLDYKIDTSWILLICVILVYA